MNYALSHLKPGRLKRIITWSRQLLIIPVFIICGCSSSEKYLRIVPNEKEPLITVKDFILPNGKNATITEITLPITEEITTAVYDSTVNLILVQYPQKKINNYLLYDLQEKKTIWLSSSNMNFPLLAGNNLLMSDKLYDTRTGQYIRDTEESLYLLDDNNALILKDDKVAKIDVRTGKIFWEGEGLISHTGGIEEYVDGRWCYVVAEGVHAINLDEGEKWDYKTPTSFTNTGKEVARQAALTCLGGFAGARYYSPYRPDVTMNMNSQPFLEDSVVYFAAKNKIVCLDRSTGKLIWENELDQELEHMKLFDVSENKIALVGDGTKFINFRYEKSDPPTIRIIQKQDGKITGLFALEDKDIAQNFICTDENIYLLTAGQFLTFDKELRLLNKRKANEENGSFIDLLSVSDTIVIHTSKGILGISKETDSDFWFTACEAPAADVTDKWLIPIVQRKKIQNLKMLNNGYYWTPNGKKGLTAFSTNKWEKAAEIQLLGGRTKFYGSKYVDYIDNKVMIVSF